MSRPNGVTKPIWDMSIAELHETARAVGYQVTTEQNADGDYRYTYRDPHGRLHGESGPTSTNNTLMDAMQDALLTIAHRSGRAWQDRSMGVCHLGNVCMDTLKRDGLGQCACLKYLWDDDNNWWIARDGEHVWPPAVCKTCGCILDVSGIAESAPQGTSETP